jgi:thiol-disulfide isomerase/thioredoxin
MSHERHAMNPNCALQSAQLAIGTLLLGTLATPALHLSAAETAGPPPNDLRIKPIDDEHVVGVIRPSESVAAARAESHDIQSEDTRWHSDYAAALAQAGREKKLVLLNFTGSDWCPPCKRLEADVFSRPEFRAYAAKNLVFVKIDFPRKRQA